MKSKSLTKEKDKIMLKALELALAIIGLSALCKALGE